MGTKGEGRRDRRQVSAVTRSEVVKKVKTLEAKRDAGMISAAGRPMTVEEWFTYWVENVAPSRVRPRTLASYRAMIRIHLLPYIGKRRLDQMMPDHLEQTYRELLNKMVRRLRLSRMGARSTNPDLAMHLWIAISGSYASGTVGR
jgi:hypothetical protein